MVSFFYRIKRVALFSVGLIVVYGFFLNKIKKDDETQDDYYQSSHIRYSDCIYQPNVKTVLLYREGFEISHPILQLNSEDRLRLSFDDFDYQIKNYSFVFIHCNANWQPSDMLIPEYIKGVPEDYIREYKYSRNLMSGQAATQNKYVHYNTFFPNDNLRFTKSGNYVVVVYDDGNKTKPVLTKRFMITEARAKITPAIKRASDVEQMYYRHEIDFTVSFFADYPLTNPYSDLRTVVLQNYRWDNAIVNLKPNYVKQNELVYDYDSENVFIAGNEYRHFDTRNIKLYGDRTERVEHDSAGTHVYLFTDVSRAFKVYSSVRDINGKRLIQFQGPGSASFTDSEVDADYVWLHFSLPSVLFTGADVYLQGALCETGLSRDCKMKYNNDSKSYQNVLLLKQGYCDYQYIVVPDGSMAGDASVIESSHFETENEYTILIYHRSTGDGYDRLIAAETFNSMGNK